MFEYKYKTEMTYKMLFEGGFSKEHGDLIVGEEYLCFITIEIDVRGKPAIFIETNTGDENWNKIRYSTLLRFARDWKMKESIFMEDNHYKLRPYQTEAVAQAMKALGEHQKGRNPSIIDLPTGCLDAETIVQINNGGNSKKMTIEQAWKGWNGKHDRPQCNWKNKDKIFIRSMIDDKIKLNKVEDIVYSGEKETIELCSQFGSLVLTPEHLVFTDKGGIRADECEGKKIAYDSNDRPISLGRESKKRDIYYTVGKNHPFAIRVNSERDGVFYKIEKHRAFYEMKVNGFKKIEDYKKAILANEPLWFMNSKTHCIHHIDGDHYNNSVANLCCMEIKEHLRHHANYANFNQGRIIFSKVYLVRSAGLRRTYDICCKDPYNNFTANRFVVHNSGKSLVIAELCHQLDAPTLILQPSKEILEQNYAKLEMYGIEDIGIYSASCRKKEIGKYTYATIGSIVKKPELFEHIEYILVDECHIGSKAGSMLDKFIHSDALKGAKIVGLTATPFILQARSRKLPNGYILTHQLLQPLTRCYPCKWRKIAYNINTSELLKQKYLSPLRYIQGKLKCERLKVNTTGSDFTKDSLENYGMESGKSIVKAIAYALNKECKKKVLVFCPCLETAEVLSKITGYPMVSGATTKKEREAILDEFKNGKTDVVLNYGVLTTGFDFPELDCIVCARPTLSLALWYQMVGRGFRIAHGKKECLVCDLSGNTERLGKVETIEMRKEAGGWKDEVWTSAGKVSGIPLSTFIVK